MKSPFANQKVVAISPSTIVFTVAFLLLLSFLYQIRSILVLLFLAFIISVALHPIKIFFEKRLRFGRILGILASYVLFFSGLTLFIGLVFPPLVREVYQLFKGFNLPLPAFGDEIRNFSFSFQELNNWVPRINDSLNVVAQVINATFNSIFTVFTLVVLSFYIMLEKDRLHLRIHWFTKDKKTIDKVEQFIKTIESQMGGWVRGQSLLMLAVGVLNYIGLSLLGIPYALPLALLAGLLEIIPNVGPTIAAIPAIFIGYTVGGPLMAGIVLLLAVVIQQLENNVLVPKIMSASAKVNPLIALILILTGLKIASVVGALLAIPFYLVVRAAYSIFYRENLMQQSSDNSVS